MAVTSADALRKAMARGERGGVFFLRGEEEYLKEELIRDIIASHLDSATRDFNLDQLRGAGLDPETLASICQTPPMMGNWRVVIVRDAQALAANARMRSVLEALLSRKLPGLALVLSAQMDSDAAIWKQVERKAKSITFKALPEGELPDWLTLHAEVQGITLEPAAARALAAAAGPTLGRLTQELEKLGQWVGDRKRINTSDVRALVGHIPNETRWEWIDMVGEARFRDARKALPPLLESESGVGLLIGLGTHLLRLALLLSDEQQLVNLLPFHQARWLPGRLKSQARNWCVPRLEAALGDVTRADRLLKSASLDDRQVMEELLLRMQCRHAAAA